MYDLNTREGKEARISELTRLSQLVLSVPGNIISYSDATAIFHYLLDIKKDLEKQIEPHIKPNGYSGRWFDKNDK